MLINGKETCNCTKKECIRHGKCEECVEFHRTDKRKPYCMRKDDQKGRLSPALGLIFGVPAGALFGIFLGQNIAVFAGVGAGLGLIGGAVLSLLVTKSGGNANGKR